MRVRSNALAALAAPAMLLHPGPAWAPFHLVVIDQVFFGTAECPDAQYVMMRMVQPGQIFIQTQRLPTQNADGSPAEDFGRFGNSQTLSNGDAGAAFIMGTADAQALFGIPFDAVTSGRLVFPDGRVCFAEFPVGGPPVDCVAYGAFTGDNAPYGQPAVSPELGMALVRRSETTDNATDFALGAPVPGNNAGQVGALGQCPGGQPTPTPTAPPTSTATPSLPVCLGDCNFDAVIAVNELILGVNISLGILPIGNCPGFDLDGDGFVAINELILAVNNALNGCPNAPA